MRRFVTLAKQKLMNKHAETLTASGLFKITQDAADHFGKLGPEAVMLFCFACVTKLCDLDDRESTARKFDELAEFARLSAEKKARLKWGMARSIMKEQA